MSVHKVRPAKLVLADLKEQRDRLALVYKELRVKPVLPVPKVLPVSVHKVRPAKPVLADLKELQDKLASVYKELRVKPVPLVLKVLPA